MPHISNFRLNGVRIPSVNTVTDSLSKDGLLRNFYRKLGFAEADKVGNAARDKGISLATAFENYRKFRKLPRKKFEKTCLANWQMWMNDTELTLSPEFVEPHLVNTVHGYHGSPDLVMSDGAGQAVLGDDKAKKRLSDYKIMMNEAAYAHCDSYENAEGKIVPVPWDVPITAWWVWTYNPKTGDLHPNYYRLDPEYFQDFLTCKKMLDVNKKAEKYFRSIEKLPEAA
jgi:hypothetical protein